MRGTSLETHEPDELLLGFTRALRTLVADDADLDGQIERLLARKQRSQEKEFVPVIQALNEFIEQELSRVSRCSIEAAPPTASLEELNTLFRDCLS